MILGLLNAHLIQKKQLSTNLNGFVGFDLLSELVVEGDLCFEKDDMWQTAYQLSAWAAVKAPGLRTILLDGTVWGNYGASSMHELAYVMATANECISAMLDKGLSLENIIPRFQLNLNLGSNLFMEIAKVRAARLLWAELLSSYGAPAEMQKIWIHGVTAYFNKTMYDPYVNMLRTTTEGFSGVIGGVDSLEILPFDCTIRPDEEFSRRIARNQQIILKEEANLDKVIDPAGGCYYIETITAELAELAWKKLQSIEETGGMYHAIKSAVIQNELAKMAMERMQNVDKRKDIFVGINMFANPIEMPLDEGDAPCDCAYQEYLDKIEAYQQTKRAGVDKAIQDLQEHHKDIMVIDNITEALQLGATLDELFPSLYPNDWDLNAPDLLSCRATIGLEGLRERHTDYQQDNEIVLSVFLANMGDVPQHKARADFATGFLQVGGFYIAGNDGFKTVDEAVEAAVFSKAQAVCICSTDNTYPEIVPEFINKMKTKSPNMIYILAGYPTDMVDTYAKDGIDLFIHMRANLLDTLAVLGAKMGVEK
jgi:methylmalonyl-CoA mutase